MGRHIHVHLNGDAFSESDHPRSQNGQFGSGGAGGKSSSKGKAGASKAPAPPNLPGPKAQAAIKAIQAAAAKGDWRGVENVSMLGVHPLVHTYRESMAKHLQAAGKALNESTGRPAKDEAPGCGCRGLPVATKGT